jgi:O-antigen/teichoic acid export membrane protein
MGNDEPCPNRSGDRDDTDAPDPSGRGSADNDPQRMTSRAQSDIATRIAAGTAWLVAARLAARAIDFLGLLILANLLLPADFGLVAVALTVVQIAEAVFELPVGQVLVRSEMITRDLLDTAFTVGLLRGALLAALMIAAAEPFAILYHDPRLAALLCMLVIAPASRAVVSPAMTHFAKAIDFRRDLLIELVGKGMALGCSIWLALVSRSYWAIAIGTIVNPVTMAAASYAVAPYRPRLSLTRWGEFAHFVGWSTASQLISAINWQIDRLLLGRLVPSAALGAYVLAGDIAAVPEQAFVKPIGRPLIAAFTQLRQDPPRLMAAYLRTVTSVLTVGLPVMLGLSILAQPAVHLALGPKWQSSWPILQWLAVSLIPPLLTAPLGALAVTLGRTDIFLRRNLIELAVTVPSIIAGAYVYGIAGVIATRLGLSLLMALVAAIFVRQLLGASIPRQCAGLWRPVVAAAGLALALFLLRGRLHGLDGLPLALGIIACAAVGLAVYGAILLLSWEWSGRPKGIETLLAEWVTSSWARFRPRV